MSGFADSASQHLYTSRPQRSVRGHLAAVTVQRSTSLAMTFLISRNVVTCELFHARTAHTADLEGPSEPQRQQIQTCVQQSTKSVRLSLASAESDEEVDPLPWAFSSLRYPCDKKPAGHVQKRGIDGASASGNRQYSHKRLPRKTASSEHHGRDRRKARPKPWCCLTVVYVSSTGSGRRPPDHKKQ